MSVPSDLRIGVDGFNLALPHGTGVATYARTLAEALQGLGRRIDLIYGLDVNPRSAREQRETLFFAALAEGRSGEEPPERVTAWGQVRRSLLSPAARDLVEVPISGRVVRQGVAARVPSFDRLFTFHRLFWIGRRYLKRYGRLLPVRMVEPPAIMHWTYPVPVRLVGARNIYTIHDLVPLRLPYLSLEDKAYHERLLRACIASADQILTVSQASRNDLMAYLGLAPEAVTAIHQAVPGFAPAAEAEIEARQLRSLFDLEPQGYFLFYGATEPKKNVGRLIEAYLGTPIDRPLVIAGPAAWHSERELRLLSGAHGKQLTRAEKVRRIDYLPTEHLALLLRGARALVFPSLHEGFGLPPVEAMRAGVPVIAGDAGALPEITGGAALLVDPYDASAIGRAMVRLDGDADLRAKLVALGKERAEAFALGPYRSALDAFHARLLELPSPALSGVTA
ncbi:glycosyltransferase involved in cell wall biosynthesis [Hephaestia caeni]|uniref:Glycosyltransferase involved in cell wall biosynthesis n=1 Tax=Hephaestia caeni TaxID=645617 RepID=A0A397PGC5_9SPHN|nr:glycosyltransferase family 1 protein [Hephaestia caeni]RIA46305.1 glycosyltransferase involved in cell wall biosynthesis [Hephaestia caeni]